MVDDKALHVAEFDLSCLINVDKSQKINDFHRSLHYPTGDPELDNETIVDNNGNVQVKVTSRFRYTFAKTTWNVQITEKLENINNSEFSEFVVNNKFHHFLYSYIILNTPSYKLDEKYRDDYQIKMTHNPGHNFIQSAVFEYSSDCQTIDSKWLDIWSMFYMKPGFRDHYEMGIGNIPILQNWSDYLPSYPLFCPQPWSYSRHESVSIPLFQCGSKTRISHKYKLRKSDELLQIRKVQRDDNGDIKKDDNDDPIYDMVKYKHKYIINGKDKNILKPEMWGRYVINTPEEINHYRNEVRNIYTEDIIMFSSENKIKSGSDTIDLNNEMKTPVKGIFIVAENQTALKYNYHSNYTDNANDHRSGYHPIKTLSSRSTGGTRYKKRPYYHFSMAMPWFRMLSAPSEMGYLTDYFGYDPMCIQSDSGLSMDGTGTKLGYEIGNTNPYVEDEDYEYDKSKGMLTNEYIVHVAMLVYKRVRYSLNSQGSNNKVTVISGFNNPIVK